METAQERELHQRQAWRPLDTMACSLETSSCSLYAWDPQLLYFGQGAVGNGMESLVSEVSTAVTSLPPALQDAMAMRWELDELLQNLWDSGEEGLSSCGALKEESDIISFQHDHRFDLGGTVSATVPTSPGKTLTPPQAKPPSSSSSQGSGDPRTSDTSGAAHRQAVGASKRSAPKEKESSKGGESCKRSRTAASSTGGSVLRPFAVVKPRAGDGEVTLADINGWILTPPARPVRHPVGEFACAPRVSAGNRPAPSGKAVAGFTRLRTAGRGTITVVRTRG